MTEAARAFGEDEDESAAAAVRMGRDGEPGPEGARRFSDVLMLVDAVVLVLRGIKNTKESRLRC